MNEENLTPEPLTPEAAAKLVDELAEIKARKKLLVDELDQRAEEIKEALADYSSASGNDEIVGTDFYAAVTRPISRKVPKAGTDQRFELERRLKHLGLWKDVDMLSAPPSSKGVSTLQTGSRSTERKSTI